MQRADEKEVNQRQKTRTVTCMPFKRSEAKQERFPSSLVEIPSVGHESIRCPGGIPVSGRFKTDSTLPMALRADGFKSHRFSMIGLLRSALIPKQHSARLFNSTDGVRFSETCGLVLGSVSLH